MTALVTARLLLRQWQPGDRPYFAALNADPEVMRYFPAPLTRQESDALADRCERLMTVRGWGFWAVELPRRVPFIGYVGLHIPAADLPCKPCVEVGWRLARPYWGKGYATEAAQASLNFAFEDLQIPEVVSFTSLLNWRSQAVMERLGMIRDPETFEHPNVPPGHILREHCLYRLTQTQWKSRPHLL
ncbi:GNAT family N-acetyltransferase [Lyngbya confervoides]|uniref:GNAT family N-acetyltransferase n=1 Tax=Lyngbya confervoides BDU141951 TaxID=1574623 RepID=A0ABD4T0V5_9CYAN|nr:GNAT family N-acetyltransferase [Lyngbya confervoides]MCM1981942.1 GNAT family N-acetyltransferase [Lyngbya confervoides BDU141951]